MAENDLSIEEIENLSYYGFMGYLEVPFFQIGGLTSTERLGELCQIDKVKKVLVVGCGTGFNACYLAKNFGCRLVGVDIAEEAIKKAKERAERENLQDRVEFRVGNAYALPFESGTFDAIITQFVSQFLDMKKAFKEFTRVLKKGGCVGINEMFKDKEMPPKVAEEIMKAEQIIGDITQLPFTIHTPEDWKEWFEKAGLNGVEIHENREPMSPKESPQLIKEIGGFWKLFKLMVRMTKYALLSKGIRNRFKKLSKAKRVLVGSPIIKSATSKHVGYILGVGKKSSHKWGKIVEQRCKADFILV